MGERSSASDDVEAILFVEYLYPANVAALRRIPMKFLLYFFCTLRMMRLGVEFQRLPRGVRLKLPMNASS